MSKTQLHNPWKGVVPYTGDPEDLRLHPFRGRDKDIEKLLDIIDANEITTLYGRSGIGKTSLINAGLFPRLREMGCSPISIRLHAENTEKHYAQIITDALSEIAEPKDHTKRDNNCDSAKNYYLWYYFATHSFVRNGVETTPIIVIDQFEETLRNNPNEAVLLLKQLRQTQEDGYLEDGTPYAINFRFVISLREDDLFLLEDALDKYYIDKMKNSRYRLQSIDVDTAIREIINIRGELYKGSAEEISIIEQKLVTLATQDNNVSSILLSLVCSMAYEAAAGGPITLDSLNKIGSSPLISYYRMSIKDLPEDFIEYLENKFIDGDRRRIVYEDSIPKQWLNMVQDLAEEHNDHRLLTKASDTTSYDHGYELLHDKLAEAIHQYTSERNIARTRSRLKRALMLFINISVIIGGLFLYSKKANVFSGNTALQGYEVPVGSKLYTVQNGFLQLTRCHVKPYTFYGNKEVTKLLLDSAILDNNALFLPNVDTLIIGESQWAVNPSTLQSALPSVKTIIARRPSANNKVAAAHRHLPSLKECIILPTDQDVLHWDAETKTLFARKDTFSSWVAYLSAYSKVLYFDNSFLRGKNVNAFRLVEMDLAHLRLPDPADKNTFYKLINTDSTITSINHDDIPEEVRKKIIFIDAPYVRKVGNKVFEYNNLMRKVILPDAQEIGESAFQNNYELAEISLPKTQKIYGNAFSGNSKILKIYLPSILVVDSTAFGRQPVFSERLWLEYNTESASARKLFGNRNVASSASNSNAERALGYHFSLKRDTIYLDSLYIPHLHIPIYTSFISWDEYKEYCIDNASVELGNRTLFKWHGDIYCQLKDTNIVALCIRTNRKRLVSIPSNTQWIKEYTVPTTGQWKEFVSMNRSDIANQKNTEDMTLYIPYDQMERYREIGMKFYDMRELNWLQTGWYELLYNNIFLSPRKIISRLAITSSDIGAFGTGFCILLLISFIFIPWQKNKRKALLFAILSNIVVLIVCGFLVSTYGLSLHFQYYCSDGEIFHSIEDLFSHLKTTDAILIKVREDMWCMLWFAIPTYLTICLLNHFTRKK